eukprot:364795-Chlamydomonas_euryale.AAC.18
MQASPSLRGDTSVIRWGLLAARPQHEAANRGSGDAARAAGRSTCRRDGWLTWGSAGCGRSWAAAPPCASVASNCSLDTGIAVSPCADVQRGVRPRL